MKSSKSNSVASLNTPLGDVPAVAAAAITPYLDAYSYWVDAWQRSLLYLDVMRQRTERYTEHAAKTAPHVLKFECELIVDGRKLSRPVNYALVRIQAPDDVVIDPKKRPFVVVDPRAGHGPGIGGFKADSEIGVAIKAGHPCYFIGFLPDPMPGQTIEDVAPRRGSILERVIALHPRPTDARQSLATAKRMGRDDRCSDAARSGGSRHSRRCTLVLLEPAFVAKIPCATPAAFLAARGSRH